MAQDDAGGDGAIAAEAERLIEAMARPRRRARPRLAEPLLDAAAIEIAAPAGQTAAWRLGEGPAVLLAHGWEDDNAIWGPLIDQIRLFGRAVVALDLPAHGFSDGEVLGPDEAAAALLAAERALGPIAAVVGHSFGCVAAILALSRGLQAGRAVLIASPIPSNGARRLDQFRARGASEAAIERAKALLASRPAGGVDILALAADMTAEALFIHSLDDDQCPPANADALSRAWPGARLMWVDGLGHRLVAQDEAVARRVAEYVEGFPQAL